MLLASEPLLRRLSLCDPKGVACGLRAASRGACAAVEAAGAAAAVQVCPLVRLGPRYKRLLLVRSLSADGLPQNKNCNPGLTKRVRAARRLRKTREVWNNLAMSMPFMVCRLCYKVTAFSDPLNNSVCIACSVAHFCRACRVNRRSPHHERCFACIVADRFMAPAAFVLPRRRALPSLLRANPSRSPTAPS